MLDQAQRLRQLAANDDNVNVENNNTETRLITVTSGKGGVGKSNFVVNLGITLQKLGKKVLIFDADLGMGNDDVLMGVISRYSVYDIISNNMSIEEVIIEGASGIHLLPGGSGVLRIEDLNEIERKVFLDKICTLKGYDYIIIDTGAGINRSVLAFISCCEELIIVTTPEPTSLTDAYSLIKAVNHFKVKEKAKIVVNRAISVNEGLKTFNKFNNAVTNFLSMKIEFLGKVTDDRYLVQAVRKQKPVVEIYPNSEAAEDIKRIAKVIDGDKDVVKVKGVQTLFNKIFKLFT